MINLETKKTRRGGNNTHYRKKTPSIAKSGFTYLNSVIDKWNYLNPERLYYIYRHCRSSDGAVFYVGVGKKFAFSGETSEYHRAHTSYGRNNFWKRTVNKHGYYVEIMLENLTYEESREKEMEFIELYGRYCDGGCLTNLTVGGDGVVGVPMTEETRIKMSESRKGKKRGPFTEEHKRNIGAKSVGRYFSPEVREKKRKSMTGKKYPPDVAQRKREARLKTCKQVLCLQTGFVFDCALDAGKAMFPNYYKSAGAQITVVCNGKADFYRGFSFCYV